VPSEGHLIKHDLEAKRLAEISSPDFPGERLVACYNAQLAEQRRNKRQELLTATEANLQALATSVAPRNRLIAVMRARPRWPGSWK
jgi:hypothetical protein